MKVYVVIEWTGSAVHIDGAWIRGVFKSYEDASHEAEAWRVEVERPEDIEIQEHELHGA